jgi:murein DD-endopeptidase MepM/ murein hydrolase activator NlpD
MFETVNPGWSTPAWGEFGAWRVHGRHHGIDYYVPRGTPLWASGEGTVEVVAFHAGGHGHFVTIRYDAGYRVSVSHLLSRSPLTVGQRVTAHTRIGTAGQTGNAEGIVWNGLIHPHVEVRRISSNLLQNPRQILRPLNRTTTADAPTRPLTEQDLDMPRLIRRTGSATSEWSLFHPSFIGPTPLERGYIITTSEATARGWARTWGDGFGREKHEPRDVYVEMQAAARVTHQAHTRGLPAVQASAAPVDQAAIARAVAAELHRRLKE